MPPKVVDEIVEQLIAKWTDIDCYGSGVANEKSIEATKISAWQELVKIKTNFTEINQPYKHSREWKTDLLQPIVGLQKIMIYCFSFLTLPLDLVEAIVVACVKADSLRNAFKNIGLNLALIIMGLAFASSSILLGISLVVTMPWSWIKIGLRRNEQASSNNTPFRPESFSLTIKQGQAVNEIILFGQLQGMARNLTDWGRSYTEGSTIAADILQPFSGLRNLISGVKVAIFILPRLGFGLLNIFYESNSFLSALKHIGLCLQNALTALAMSAVSVVRGVVQITAWPCTLLIKIPLRLYLTNKATAAAKTQQEAQEKVEEEARVVALADEDFKEVPSNSLTYAQIQQRMAETPANQQTGYSTTERQPASPNADDFVVDDGEVRKESPKHQATSSNQQKAYFDQQSRYDSALNDENVSAAAEFEDISLDPSSSSSNSSRGSPCSSP